MDTSAATSLEQLLHFASSDSGVDRKALAGLLVELAYNLEPDFRSEPIGVAPVDPRLRQLRELLFGHEIETLSRLRDLLDDPERLAAAVGRVLPTAIAEARSDPRLGQVLTPAFEGAAQSSIRSNPKVLIDILHPLFGPAMRKSIGEAIDQTFQSLNESLKHSLTWRGLRWRWEAWRTGTSFAEVVLKHTLVYQIEHAFLIHNHTGLLIAHAAAEDATSQDPQLVSSMLVAIQDFVRDSFGSSGQQTLDSLRLGELRLWSEPGQFATLVAVIRGNPPEALHEALRQVLMQIHEGRPQALENFDGDSSGLADIEAYLTECAALKQRAPRAARTGFPWFVAVIGVVLLTLAGAAGYRSWQNARVWQNKERLWTAYIARLRAEPGIVVTNEKARYPGRFLVAGLRDPLAANPQAMLRRMKINPSAVVSRWAPYEALDPRLVLKRLQVSLKPPAGVTLAVAGNRILARGSASSAWLERAHTAALMLPAGSPGLDLSALRNSDKELLAKLHQATQTLRKEIQSEEIHFNTNRPLPAPGQDAVLDALARQIKKIASLASAMHAHARVILVGHSDDTGRETFNLSLSLARAGAVLTLLRKRGVDPQLLTLRGAGPLEPIDTGNTDAARSANRRVSFDVAIEK